MFTKTIAFCIHHYIINYYDTSIISYKSISCTVKQCELDYGKNNMNLVQT